MGEMGTCLLEKSAIGYVDEDSGESHYGLYAKF
jgi:hypothetical protein